MKKRVDVLLFENGVCRSRAEAGDLVSRGLVCVLGQTVTKPSKGYDEEEFKKLCKDGTVQVKALQYVGRGGYKLAFALDHFGLRVGIAGKRCLDVGSSTGGFTQVLLESGASYVHAVDVGSMQFDRGLLEKYKSQIDLRENTDIRSATDISDVDVVVCDVSFLSIKEVLSCIKSSMAEGAVAVVLVKPQFEVGREYFKDRQDGIVKDEAARAEVLESVIHFAKGLGLEVQGSVESPIHGGSGNVEYLLYLKAI
jgi:23S rRNA (cytidine1920-2'-O)/16S rRNA (cytidine1409-2'-O)-methyltransferase